MGGGDGGDGGGRTFPIYPKVSVQGFGSMKIRKDSFCLQAVQEPFPQVHQNRPRPASASPGQTGRSKIPKPVVPGPT